MKETNCVYLITNKITNQQYVGVTKDFKYRMYQHSVSHDKNKSYIDNAILKYGWDNFSAIIIDNYNSEDERKILEQKYIKELHTHRSEGGYNITWGGDDNVFPDVSGSNNPRAQLTEQDVARIRERRMNGERLADVYQDYADKLEGNRRAGFSKIWLHESWPNVHSEFKGKYPLIDNRQFATIRHNSLEETDLLLLEQYYKWHGPIKYNVVYPYFKTKVDWQTFQEISKNIIEKWFGNKSTIRYRNKTGETQRRIDLYRLELQEEPKLS